MCYTGTADANCKTGATEIIAEGPNFVICHECTDTYYWNPTTQTCVSGLYGCKRHHVYGDPFVVVCVECTNPTHIYYNQGGADGCYPVTAAIPQCAEHVETSV